MSLPALEMLDKGLASSDFCQRLHVVSITDESGTSKIWWPALKFDSHKELMNALASDMDGMDGLNVLKAKVTVTIHRKKKIAGVGVEEKCGVAYLLGRKQDEDMMVLLPENHEGLVGDFFTHYEDMAAGKEGVRKAMELALERLAEEEVAPHEAAGACAPRAEGGKLAECVETASYVAAAVTSTVIKPRRSDRTVFSVEQSGYVPSAKKAKKQPVKKANQESVAKKAKGKAPVKKSEAANAKNVSVPQNEEIYEKTMTPIKLKSVVVNGDEPDLSPLRCSQDCDSSISLASRAHRYVPLKDKNASWYVVWQDMKANGWGYKQGSGLVSYYYVHPTSTHLTRAQLLEQCKEGVDYFLSEEAVKKYVAKEYGWEGEVDSPLSTMPVDVEIAERIKRKPRKQQAVKRTVQAKHVLASAGRVNQAASKKAAKNTGRSPQSSPDVASEYESEETSDSGGEGFSQGGSIEESVEKKLTGKKLSYGRNSTYSKLKKVQEEDEESSTPSTATSSSDNTSIDPTYQVMKSRDAWELLMKLFGFSYHRGKYVLPGQENKPGKDSAAVEGIHYFDSIEKLRKNLCAYGLPEPKEELSKEVEVDFERWVRYAHARSLSDGALINGNYTDEPISSTHAWRLLAKLGLKYGAKGYCIPESETTELKLFDRSEDFYEHLARFGIPCIVSGSALDDKERRQLDLYLFSPGATNVNTFQRINPESGEVAPRTRKNVSQNPAPADIRESRQSIANHKTVMSKAKRPSKFEQDFDLLTQKRTFPPSFMSTSQAINVLEKHYNLSVCSDDSQYCFTDTHTTNEFKFSNPQDLRENLCEYGMPPLSKGSSISKQELSDLESWVRCAHITALRYEDSGVPAFEEMNYQEAKTVIKGLGYQISKEFGRYVLQGASFSSPAIGKDGWNNLHDFINHLARFGLAQSNVVNAKSHVSSQDILRFEIFVASVATFDISKRLRCESPAKASASKNTEHLSALLMSSLSATGDADPEEIARDHDDNAQAHPAVMIEDHVSPHPSPPKKSKTQKGMLGFLVQTGQKALEYLTPTRGSSKTDRSFSSDSPEFSLTASDLEKGDDDLEACAEACRAGTPPNTRYDNSASSLPSESGNANAEKVAPKCPPEKIAGLSAAKDPEMSWTEMELQMKAEGLKHIPGSGLDSYWYVHPAFAEARKADLLSNCKEGEHYFKSEESLKSYARNKLGWIGGDSDKMEAQEVLGSRSRRASSSADSPPKRSLSKGANSPTKKARRPSPKSGASKILTDSTEQPASGRAKEDDAPKKLFEDDSMQQTVKDILERAQFVLHPSYSSKYCSVSSFRDEVMEFMSKSVETGMLVDGAVSRSPGFLYMCGRPGTGKTTVVSQCTDDIVHWAVGEQYNKPLILAVNMASLSTAGLVKDGIMKAVLKKLEMQIGSKKEDLNIDTLRKWARKDAIILVIDEIDMLIKNRDSDGESFLRELVGLARDEDLKFSLIGISNSVNDKSSGCIKQMGVSQELVFSSYDEQGLLAILQERLGYELVDAKALELVARRIAAASGDARRVLEITSNAIGRCIDGLSEEELAKEVDATQMPIVKIRHMMGAIRDGNAVKHSELIRRQPQMAKIVLCIAVAMGHARGPNANISISMLRKFCILSTKHAMFDDTDISSVMTMVQNLVDADLLFIDNNNEAFDIHDPDAKLQIGVQLDDVECALEESLLNGENGAFYSKVMEFVRTHGDHC